MKAVKYSLPLQAFDNFEFEDFLIKRSSFYLQ